MKDDGYGRNCVPPPSPLLCPGPNPQHLRRQLQLDRVFKEVTKVKRGQTGRHWGPWTPSPRGDTGGRPCEDRGRDESDGARCQGRPGAAGSWRRQGWGGSSPELQSERGPADSAISALRPLQLQGTNFGCLKSPSSWYSVRAALGSQGTPHRRGQGFCT